MGWFDDTFGDKKVRISGIQHIDLGANLWAEREAMRRDIIFASKAKSKPYIKGMWHMQHGLRHKYNRRRMLRAGLGPKIINCQVIHSTYIDNAIVSGDPLRLSHPTETYGSPVNLKSPTYRSFEHQPVGTIDVISEIQNNPFLDYSGVSENLEKTCTTVANITDAAWYHEFGIRRRDSLGDSNKIYTPEIKISDTISDTNVDSNGNVLETTQTVVYHKKNISNGLYRTDKQTSYDISTYVRTVVTVRTYGTDGVETGTPTVTTTDTIEVQSVITPDLSQYLFQAIVFDGGTRRVFVFISDADYAATFYSTTSSFQAEPHLPLEKTSGKTDQDKKNDKIIEYMGLSMDNMQTVLDDGKVQGLSVGMYFNLGKLSKDATMINALFETLDTIKLAAPSKVGSNAESDPLNKAELGQLGINYRDVDGDFEVELEVGHSGSSKARFSLAYEQTNVAIPSGKLKLFKLELKSRKQIWELMYPEARAAFAVHYGENSIGFTDAGSYDNSGYHPPTPGFARYFTGVEYYDYLHNDYDSNANPPASMIEAVNDMPTRSDLESTERLDLKVLVQAPEASTAIQLNDYLNEKDREDYYVDKFRKAKSIVQDVAIYDSKKIRLPDNTTAYRITRISINGTRESYLISNMSLYFEYNGDVFHRYLSDEQEDQATEFLLPTKYGVLDHKGMYEYLMLYDSLLGGVIFATQVQTIKWYQRGIFKWVIIIVSIIISAVITYFSGGAASGFGAALTSAAWSFAVYAAVAYAIAFVVEKLGIGGNIALIIAIVVSIYTGDYTSLLTSPALWGAVADQVLKYEMQKLIDEMNEINKQMKEIEERQNKLQMLMSDDALDGARPSKESMISIANQSAQYNTGENIDITEEMLDKSEQDRKYNTPPTKIIKPIDTDRLVTRYHFDLNPQSDVYGGYGMAFIEDNDSTL